jgi:hypothetical protein
MRVQLTLLVMLLARGAVINHWEFTKNVPVGNSVAATCCGGATGTMFGDPLWYPDRGMWFDGNDYIMVNGS